MGDKNIPPPNVNFNRKNFNELTEDSFLEDNFNDYLRETNERKSKKRKQEREEDDRRLKSKRKSAMTYEELQQNARKQAEQNRKTTLDEQMDLEEGEFEEFQQELDKQNRSLKKQSKEVQRQTDEDSIFVPKKKESQGKKMLQDKKPASQDKETSEALKKQAEAKEAKSLTQKQAAETEEEQLRAIQENNEAAEEGEEVETPNEEDPLKKMKQELKREKDIAGQKGQQTVDKGNKKDKTEKKDEGKTEKKDEGKESEQLNKGSKMDTNPATVQITQGQAQPEKIDQPIQASQFQSTQEKSEQLKEFEEMAMQIISEAQVLEDGDVIETTVQINSENPQFDKGEVTVTAYKYRPLEVNLKFENFNPHASKLMQKKKKELKKGLQTKSLKVHQLDIIE